ncbi:phenylacetate--CoA ligase family protein [bacterium]|nr:MAG: phenylacetate--CoA ligase family protein [bacterium]
MPDLSSRKAIEEHQVERLRQILQDVLETNEFYRSKLLGNSLPKIDSLDGLKLLPFTTKSELVEDQLKHPPFGTDLTYPLEKYIHIHQTSGTTGKPMYWLDTEDSWNWWAECWKVIFQAAGVHAGDRVYFAFSFGPFIGFWAGWEGARKVGTLAISGGGQSSFQRIKAIMDYQATVVVCTPTYALHMASEARKAGIDLAQGSSVRITIHAGEPGASIPSTKRKIEEEWGAKCYDHPGATEVGAYGFECEPQPGGVHVNEREFIAEVIDPKSGAAVREGERGELVITNLGRIGSPVIRYRTGDLVQPSYQPCLCGRTFMLLQGGVLGRVDDMIVVRGVNVFPSAIENIMRGFPEIEEFRVEAIQREALPDLKLILEPRPEFASFKGLEERVVQRFRESIGLRPRVELVSPGTLPRFELKAKRFFKL